MQIDKTQERILDAIYDLENLIDKINDAAINMKKFDTEIKNNFISHIREKIDI